MALTDNLISYWKLDEASGNALDAHGTNELTDNNTVGSAVGKIGNARDFEASSTEYFSRADNASLSTGDIDFTFAAWVKAESLPASLEYPGIISKTAGTSSREYLVLYDSDAGRFVFSVSSDGTTVTAMAANSLGAPSTGTWYHIIAWHDAAANTINIQVNGGTVDSVAHSTGVLDGTNAFTLGITFGGLFNSYFDGLIDEVGFWKRVLTADERTALYNNGNGFAYPFTVASATTRPGRVPRNMFSPVGRAQRRMGSPIGRAR